MDELIDAARVPVFLLDEHQVVRPGESAPRMRSRRRRGRGADVHTVDSTRSSDVAAARLRANGSSGCWVWPMVARLMDRRPLIRGTTWRDAASALEALLRANADAGYGARMAAGYCWPWSDPRADGSLVADVSSATGRGRGTCKGDRSVGGAPPAACGRLIRPASVRSAASIRRRDSSTTGTA